MAGPKSLICPCFLSKALYVIGHLYIMCKVGKNNIGARKMLNNFDAIQLLIFLYCSQ